MKSERLIEIEVNNKPVHFPDERGRDEATGIEIKGAAIAQGVPIQLTFPLFQERGNKLVPVGDDQAIYIRQGEKFRCVAPDDTSTSHDHDS